VPRDTLRVQLLSLPLNTHIDYISRHFKRLLIHCSRNLLHANANLYTAFSRLHLEVPPTTIIAHDVVWKSPLALLSGWIHESAANVGVRTWRKERLAYPVGRPFSTQILRKQENESRTTIWSASRQRLSLRDTAQAKEADLEPTYRPSRINASPTGRRV